MSPFLNFTSWSKSYTVIFIQDFAFFQSAVCTLCASRKSRFSVCLVNMPLLEGKFYLKVLPHQTFNAQLRRCFSDSQGRIRQQHSAHQRHFYSKYLAGRQTYHNLHDHGIIDAPNCTSNYSQYIRLSIKLRHVRASTSVKFDTLSKIPILCFYL